MIRDARTPSVAQLDAEAIITPADQERAAQVFRATLRGSPRRSLTTLLDASATHAGPATGPVPDEAS